MKATGIVRRIDDLGARGHPQGDPQDDAHPRGRPVTDIIVTVGAVLRRDAGSGKTGRVVIVHPDEAPPFRREYSKEVQSSKTRG